MAVEGGVSTESFGVVAIAMGRKFVPRCQFVTHTEAKAAIVEWLEVFYNRERPHSAPRFQTPVDFEANLN